MHKLKQLMLISFLILSFPGCATNNYNSQQSYTGSTLKGGAIGGLLGGGLGAAVGSAFGYAGLGSLIGASAGASQGAALAAKEQISQQQAQQEQPKYQKQQRIKNPQENYIVEPETLAPTNFNIKKRVTREYDAEGNVVLEREVEL